MTDGLSFTPFGAVVVRDGVVIGQGVSEVVARKDPTAHAEVNAIREAAQTAGSHPLTGAELYASGYPCPLCLSAAVWAGIDKVWFGAGLGVSSEAGFEDLEVYKQFMMGPAAWTFDVEPVSEFYDVERADNSIIGWKTAFDLSETD